MSPKFVNQRAEEFEEFEYILGTFPIFLIWIFFSDGGGSPHFDFGGAASPQEYQMNLTFIEAAKGVEKELKVNILDTCETCGGTGNQACKA